MSEYTSTTIVFPRRSGEVLLGMKKRGFGEGWWNGFGGKLKPGETFEVGARRETLEEVGLTVNTLCLIARLLFYFDDRLHFACEAFVTTNFSGTPVETDEMRPQWFNEDALPFEQMWPADRLWIPEALKATSTQPFTAAIYFDAAKTFQHLETPSDTMITEIFELEEPA